MRTAFILIRPSCLHPHACASGVTLCFRLHSKTAALSRQDDGLLVIISDLMSYSQVTTWRATQEPQASCSAAGHNLCSGDSDTCSDESIDDDGMAGLPDVEETLNVFLR